MTCCLGGMLGYGVGGGMKVVGAWGWWGTCDCALLAQKRDSDDWDSVKWVER